MNHHSYLIMVEVPAMGPIHDLHAALQASYDKGSVDGTFRVLVTREPGYMVSFLRSVQDHNMQDLIERVREGAGSLQLAAMRQLAAELEEGAAEIARPVIEDLVNGDAQVLDFNGVLSDALPTASHQTSENPDEPESSEGEPRVYQHYTLHTAENGMIRGVASTNDNLDKGYPSEYAEWEVRYLSRSEMEKQTGKSHTGVWGCEVLVYLDGEKI